MIHCPYCQADGPTFVDYEIGPLLYIYIDLFQRIDY